MKDLVSGTVAPLGEPGISVNHEPMTFMSSTPLLSRSHGSSRASHSTVREGVRLGSIIGVVTWLWIAAVDVAAGAPFETPRLLSGIVGFTVFHFGLCFAYGLTVMALVHASMKEPTVIYAIIFCTILFQIAFAMFTAILANTAVGEMPWMKFVAGNVIAGILTYALVARDHSMRDIFLQAETYED
jgi:hypothetical protein